MKKKINRKSSQKNNRVDYVCCPPIVMQINIILESTVVVPFFIYFERRRLISRASYEITRTINTKEKKIQTGVDCFSYPQSIHSTQQTLSVVTTHIL